MGNICGKGMSDKRAIFRKDSYFRGYQAEKYLNYIFDKKKWNYKWFNKSGKDSMKPFDFAIFNKKGGIKFLIECEYKAYKYEEIYVREGVDFIYRKVNRKYPATCYYFMTIGNDNRYEYIIYQSMDYIREYGKKERKYTNRDRSKLESFMRLQFDKCIMLSPPIKELQ
jgi:hypothetical protein